jgi:hypothetical protein
MEYNTKEELIYELIGQYGLCEGARFKKVNQYNQLEFETDFKNESITVGELNERISKLNFLDKYYQKQCFRVKEFQNKK